MRILVLVAGLWAATAAAEPVELLHNVPSRLAVSSAVESKTIEPRHLVDGDRATAWNSATGDLVGGWIEFAVPAEVAVDEIRLIVGHTGKGKEGDYFPLNHRIKRVRILRDDTKVGDFDLDPSSRELQAIKIGKPGGRYRIRVLKTVAGKRRSWRELAVAELEVWGTVPAPMQPGPHEVTHYTGIRVGELGPPNVTFKRATGTAPTLDARCRLNLCKPADPTMVTLAPTGSAFRSVVVEPGDRRGYARIFVETEAGWWLAGVMDMGTYADAGYTAKVEQLAVEGDLLQVTVDFQASTPGDHTRLYTVCGLAGDRSPSCLAKALGLEVVHTKYKVDIEHVVRIADGYLRITRGTRRPAWEWEIGDHRLAF